MLRRKLFLERSVMAPKGGTGDMRAIMSDIDPHSRDKPRDPNDGDRTRSANEIARVLAKGSEEMSDSSDDETFSYDDHEVGVDDDDELTTAVKRNRRALKRGKKRSEESRASRLLCQQILCMLGPIGISGSRYQGKLRTPFGTATITKMAASTDNFLVRTNNQWSYEDAESSLAELSLPIEFEVYQAIYDYLCAPCQPDIRSLEDVQVLEKLELISRIVPHEDAACALCAIMMVSEPMRHKDGGKYQRSIVRGIISELISKLPLLPTEAYCHTVSCEEPDWV
ncbi:MAG: hypothetical protein LBF12_05225 [Christensenellaceae bacterium]|jgi:hypothetical protein|nr:hypothetical protein [Christensenellaceae bacterium]